MSGISKSYLEDLSSEKVYEDRIPHIYNILRFAILKKDHSLMAFGGPWHAVDGGDPSVDDSSLIQTARRLFLAPPLLYTTRKRNYAFSSELSELILIDMQRRLLNLIYRIAGIGIVF